jgi:hypothetical protein
MAWQSLISPDKQDTPLPSSTKLAQYVSRHPGDSYLHLAQANLEARRAEAKEEKPTDNSSTIESLRAAQAAKAEKVLDSFRAVAARFPDSPAANLQLASRLLAASGPGQRAEAWGSAKTYNAHPSRTPEQAQNLAEAGQYFLAAAKLDPANAAPEYLLAYTLYQQGKDEAARQALSGATQRLHWSLYSREIRKATVELFETGDFAAINVPLYVSSVEAQNLADPPLRDLAHLLAGLGEKPRQKGDAAGALPYQQAAIHLGHIMLEGADSISDGLAAAGIIAIASGHFITQEEIRRIKNSGLPRELQISRQREIRREHFRSYLISQGKAELAGQYERDYQRAESLKEKSRQFSDTLMTKLIQALGSRYLVAASLILVYAVYALGLFLLAAIVALFTGTFRTPAETPRWGWGEWLGLMALVGVLGWLLIRLYPLPSDPGFLRPGIGARELFEVALILILFLAPLLGGLRKTRGEAFRSAKARLAGVLAGYRILMPPTFAVLLAAALVMIVLGQSSLQKWAAQEKQMVLQGEVQSGKLIPKE